MRRKIRLSDTILANWRKKFMKRHSSLVSGSPLRIEDLDREFERDGRKFTIIGLTSLDSILLSEKTDEGIVHWEASQQYVQMCVGRYNEAFIRNELGGFGSWERMEYNLSKMYLPPTGPSEEEPEPQEPADEREAESDDSSEAVEASSEETHED